MPVIKSGMVQKKAVGKSLLGLSNWKKRFLVLDYCYVSYYDKYWDVSKDEPDNGAALKNQFKVCDIRAVEHVDDNAFEKQEVFQVVYEDVEETAKSATGAACLRNLYIEADGGVASGAETDRNQWINCIRDCIAEVGDVTILQSRFCPGVIVSGKSSCCQRSAADLKEPESGCKAASQVKAARTGELKNSLNKSADGGDKPKLPTRKSNADVASRPKMELPPQSRTVARQLSQPNPSPIAARIERQTSLQPQISQSVKLNDKPRGAPVPTPRPGIVSRASVKDNKNVTKQLENEEWFVRNWTSVETSTRLMQQEEGAFYVRISQSKANAFTVDIRTNDSDEPIVAKRVYLTEDGFYRFEADFVTHASLRACLQNCSDYKVTLPHARREPQNPPRLVTERSESAGRFRGANFVKASPSTSSDRPPPMPARKPPTRAVVNTSCSADEDEIYGDVRSTLGQYEDVDFCSVEDNTTGEATNKVREMVAMTGTPNNAEEEEFGGFETNLRQKNKLWTHRPDVTPEIIASITKGEVKRQEAIYELVYSEQAYMRDVNDFIAVYLKPIQAKKLMDTAFTQKLVKSALAVQAVGNTFLRELEARQAATVVVDCVADILLRHVDEMSTRFYEYSDIALETREKLSSPAELVNFLQETRDTPASRGLTMDAYSLSPVQRMVRYPLLVEEVLKKTDSDPTERAALSTAHNKWREALNKCNSRLKEIEEWHNLKDIHNQLNYSKVTGSDPVWSQDDAYGFRSMVKRGQLEMCKLNDTKKKINKRKGVEVMLLSDVFLFAKSMKNKSTGKIEYVVYKQAHRSLIECEPFRSRESKMDNLIEIQLISDSGIESIYFKTKDPMMRDRWLEAFNPPKEEEDIYQAWECPQFKVIKDHTPSYDESGDGMPLKRGQIVEVEKKGDICMKGRLKNPPPFATFNTSGYFPADCVTEIESNRSRAREVKRIQNSKKF